MANGRSSSYGYSRRRYGYHNRGAQGQGRMRAEFSGAVPLVRHAVNHTNKTIADGKAYAYPLVVYYGTSSASDGESASASISENSRVNHVGINLSINQADTTKSNQCYVALIATSFSEAMLDATNMTNSYADLISVNNATTGTMNLLNGAQDLTIREWNVSATLRHHVRGFQRNTYTLYSGRPALLNTTIRVPPKCKRGQFGMGFWLVVMNDSADIQNETSGDATDVNVGLQTFFKEIPPTATTLS
jgi:hypothetical protein